MRLLAIKQINLTTQRVSPGEVFEVADRMGSALIKLGAASLVKDAPVETAAIDLGAVEKSTEK